MNNLIAFGDSFTWGSELKDDMSDGVFTPSGFSKYKKYHHPNTPMNQFADVDFNHRVLTQDAGYSKHTWPALYADANDMEYKCFAQPGCSNSSISRRFFKFLPFIHKDDLVIINWTWIDRWDVFNSDAEEELLNKIKLADTATDVYTNRHHDHWMTLRPNNADKSQLSKLYFKYLQSELWNKFESLKLMALVYLTLASKGIPFIMTSIDTLPFDKLHHCPDYIANLQNEIKDDFVWFDNMGFYEWAVQSEFKLGKKDGHPLEDAHIAAFEYIKEHHNIGK